MGKISKYTKWKVISGYIIVFLLSLLFAGLIYKQTTRFISNEKNKDYNNEKLFLLGNITTGLYEAEGLGNAFIQTGSQEYFRDYMTILKQTAMNIDSLKKLTSRDEQRLRIDSIHLLLNRKTDNLQELAWIKRRFIPDDLYDKALDNIESNRNTQKHLNIRKRLVVSVDSSYTKTEKKKRRWLFSKNQPDSVLHLSTHVHTVTDTLTWNAAQNKDSVVHILKSAWEDVQKQTQNFNRQIDQKEYILISQNTDITGQLKRILNDYEQEEFNLNRDKQNHREETLSSALRLSVWSTVIALLFIAFFLFFILRDLSRSQRYRQELEEANRYAGQLLKSREKMIQTVTHDIKSPLSSVIGYIELLNNTSISERQRYFLKNMKGSSEHILQLVGNLLDLSKLENNRMTVEEVIFNPARLFHEIADNFLPLASAKQLCLKSEFGEELNRSYHGDVLRIRQIITNILSNAIKYTSSGEVSFTATHSTESKVIITIQDTGTGMTPEEQKIIFEEFTRLTSHSAIEGTGLGLTISLKLIQLLNGQIELESTPGEGSRFRVILPLKKADTDKIETPEETTVPTLSKEIKILLVDDDPLQLEMTAGLLASKGIKTDTTTQPKEVADKLNSKPYDLIFSDIQMPGMNGFELVKQIRLRTSADGEIPVIALSADSDKQEKDYLAAGFTAFLPKPFTPLQLFQLINRFANAEIHTPKETSQESDNPADQSYTLIHIQKFTDNDPEALKAVITSFISTTEEHCRILKTYIEEKQWSSIARLAHKMLPMFRQLEVHKVIIPLEKLERSEKDPLSEEEIIRLTEEVIEEARLLIPAINQSIP